MDKQEEMTGRLDGISVGHLFFVFVVACEWQPVATSSIVDTGIHTGEVVNSYREAEGRDGTLTL